MEQKIVSNVGSIVYFPQEGGLYGIVLDDGTRYNPVDLPPEFKIDGLQVSFTVAMISDAAGDISGVPVEVVNIEPAGGG